MAGDDIFIHPVVMRAYRFVEGWMGVTRTELISRRRHVRLVRARALFVAIIQRHTTFSYPNIGRLLGDRHHTTIMNLAKQLGPRLRERSVAFCILCDRFDPTQPPRLPVMEGHCQCLR